MRTYRVVLACALIAGCPDDPTPIADDIFVDTLGEVLPSATPDQRETFARGEEVAVRRFDAPDGLGPHFNLAFCAGCHEKPVFGGSAPRYRDFLLVGQELADGSRVELGVNGVLPQFEITTTSTVTPTTCVDADGNPTDQMGVPPGSGPQGAVVARRPEADEANQFAKRNPIPFFGVGLIAEIDEDEILRNVDEDDRDGDGISGRPNFDRGFVGRFGRKAQTVSIEGFIRGPLFNHMGITTNPLSPERQAQLPVPSVAEVRSRADGLGSVGRRSDHQAAAPSDPITDDDGVCDPEMSEDMLFDLVSWAMLLAPPAPDEPTEESESGAALFEEIQCASCHVPALRSPRGLIPLYSDLLLHDMGPDMADGVSMGRAGDPANCEGGARGCEYRTQPLWGVVATGPYLHDGRADTMDEAIRFHGGEGSGSRDAYLALSDAERAQVLAFLTSLGGSDQASEGLLPPNAPIPPIGVPGGPFRDLDGSEEERFRRGRAIFDRDVPLRDGLGPNFNGDSCRACHFDPVIGGAGPVDVNVSRHGTLTGDEFTAPAMGTMAHRHAVASARPPFDDTTNIVGTFQTPTTLGMGLIDRIAEDTILANEDPDDLDDDGISGRARRVEGDRVGRFGWRSGVPSTAEFVRDAMFNELGLTLPSQPGLTFGAESDADDVADPEISLEDVEAMAFFLNTLAPPARVRTDAAAEDAGEGVFASIGCADCHMNLDADGMTVPLYSDLLLHDVQAPEYGGIGEGDAGFREFRTAPLWGIGRTAPYMHDGGSVTLEQAIADHFGEADAARTAYEALDGEARANLLRFLESL
ncbi:MAG: di-heme oxidoredictase family protein [Myxococcota bacterium]